MNSRYWIAGVSLFLALWCIYALSFRGVSVSDDEQLFMSAAQHLAVHGELSAPQMFGNGRLIGRYSGVGPLHPILAAQLYALVEKSELGAAQAFFLINPIYTALTAVVIYLLVIQKGFTLRTGLTCGLVFGLATIAWPYAQTFFREPLAGLLLAGAWLSLGYVSDVGSSPVKRSIAFASFGVLFTGAIVTKIYTAAALLGFTFLLVRQLKALRTAFTGKRKAGLVLVPAVTFLVLLGAYELLSAHFPAGVNTRLSEKFVTDQVVRAITRFDLGGMMVEAAGMLFSPGKGLLLYCPVLALLLAAIPLWGSHRSEFAALPVITATGFIVAQYGAYDTEWWGITWGTRFLLPVIPLLAVIIAPAIETMMNSEKTWMRATFWGLLLSSVVIQLGGVIISDATYLKDLYFNQQILDLGQVIWQPDHAALTEHWRILFSGTPPDLGLWRVFMQDPRQVNLTLVMIFSIAAISIRHLMASWRGERMAITSKPRLWAAVPAAAAVVLTSIILLAAVRGEERYSPYREDLISATHELNEGPRIGDAIVIDDYLSPAWYHYLNFGRPSVPWFSLPRLESNVPAATSAALFKQLCKDYERVWLLEEGHLPKVSDPSTADALGATADLLQEYHWGDPAGRESTLRVYKFTAACKQTE